MQFCGSFTDGPSPQHSSLPINRGTNASHSRSTYTCLHLIQCSCNESSMSLHIHFWQPVLIWQHRLCGARGQSINSMSPPPLKKIQSEHTKSMHLCRLFSFQSFPSLQNHNPAATALPFTCAFDGDPITPACAAFLACCCAPCCCASCARWRSIILDCCSVVMNVL